MRTRAPNTTARHHGLALLVLPCALIGCGSASGDLAADYTLQLIPRIPQNQAPFEGGAVVKVVLRDLALVEAEVTTLGELETGTVDAGGFGPLDGHRVGLLVEAPGGPAGAYSPENLIAYGEVGPFALGAGEESSEVPVLLAGFGSVGELEALDSERFLSAAAMTADGDVYLFGGTDDVDTTFASDDFLRLESLDAGDWAFRSIGSIPPDNSASHGLVGMTADIVDDDGTELILVAGGRHHWFNSGPNSSTQPAINSSKVG